MDCTVLRVNRRSALGFLLALNICSVFLSFVRKAVMSTAPRLSLLPTEGSKTSQSNQVIIHKIIHKLNVCIEWLVGSKTHFESSIFPKTSPQNDYVQEMKMGKSGEHIPPWDRAQLQTGSGRWFPSPTPICRGKESCN